MPVKDFKFVSPGVFINEIDNSFRPRQPDAIGATVIGRSVRGLAMQPTKVPSFSEYVTNYGDTVPGNGGGDIARFGNLQSPMYGTYAAKAYLDAQIAPLTYLRLLGHEHPTQASGLRAGWATPAAGGTVASPNSTLASNGGAFGLFIFPTGSANGASLIGAKSGKLAAVFYLQAGSSIMLKGTGYGNAADKSGSYTLIRSDANKELKVLISSNVSAIADETVTFNMDYQSENFIRNKFNTNPQLVSINEDYYPSTTEKGYWLGETFEQFIRDNSLVNVDSCAAIVALALNGTVATGPHNLSAQSAREAVAGWFVPQDLGDAGSFDAANLPKLFRLKGRGHGSWLHKNIKVSIERIKESTSFNSDYGTFSVVIRAIGDTDSNSVILERFDNVSLNPNSESFLSKVIGNKFHSWDEPTRTLREYGEYDNNSRYVYVETNPDMDEAALDPKYLPFGFYMPPKFTDATSVSSTSNLSDRLIVSPANVPPEMKGGHGGGTTVLTSSVAALTCSFLFPSVALRLSASDGGLSDETEASFGMRTTTEATTNINDPSVIDMHRLLRSGFSDDPTTTAVTGFDSYSSIFTLNDVVSSSAGNYFYSSGSRQTESTPLSASQLLDAGYDSFTAPFWGGFDGFDITKPDPLANKLMSATSDGDKNNYVYYTYKRAIDTIADPEFINTNLIAVPGLTKNALTEHLVRTAEARADALALIDLENVYIPPHEGDATSYSTRASRVATTPRNAANALKRRQIDSSYGTTFYPWVQTRDSTTGQNVWVPPTVAMMGVLASSERASEVWFAPAGFNRGGLSDGAAGIPVVGVSERLRSKDRDLLYDARINPIASFPSTGIVLFGQKTLQERPSALDRINVRRLVIYLKKQISILSTQILFEQNVQATWGRFKGLIEPLLASTKNRFGITDYRLILDETTTTPDLVDQNVLYAKIMIKPAKAIEFIAIDFVVASSGASFED